MNGEATNPLATWLGQARWFGGKGRPWELTARRRVGTLGGDAEGGGVRAVVDLLEVTYLDEEGGSELYQAPLALYREPQGRLAHAVIGAWDDEDLGPVHVYDAVHDRDAMALWLEAFAAVREGTIRREDLVFHRLPGHDLDLEAHSTLFSGEQSNSSVAFGEDSLMKVFRKVTPGVNPDISIHQVLTEAGSEHVAALYGWLDLVDEPTQSTLQLAMLQQFLRTASDGWELALTSVRNLFAEADLHAEEVGGDFAAEAARLGQALAEVHLDLAEHFPVEQRPASSLAHLSEAMHLRLDHALGVVPDLAPLEGALRRAYDRLRRLDGLRVQQIHGDLHLGQTLRTSRGWKIVDFEGEPATPLAERVKPDSPWRDVAGMLRSFDYAPRVVALTGFSADPGNETDQQAYRAAEWAERNKQAFLDAYLETSPSAAGGRALLDAYLVDKGVYEVVYEARNRPGWLSIPLSALTQTLTSSGDPS